MRILIIRHGDPDYEHDTLTEKGRREAQLLSDRLVKEKIDSFYLSPLGRAKDTAAYTLERLGANAVEMPWLREFHAPVIDPDTGKQRGPWDLLPTYWTAQPVFYDRQNWQTAEIMTTGNVAAEAQRVYEGIDSILADHGYERDGELYKAVRPNRETIALFCHFGVECVMLGHLLGISPVVLWHGFCAAPTSVTTLYSEERRQSTAYFRMSSFGDTGHLYAAGEPVAFAARFCEIFDCDERHD